MRRVGSRRRQLMIDELWSTKAGRGQNGVSLPVSCGVGALPPSFGLAISSATTMASPPPPPAQPPPPMDRYGFYLEDEGRGAPAVVTTAASEARKKKEAERSLKWAKMLKTWDRVVSARQEKLKRRVRKGIPDAIRGSAWLQLSEAWRYRKQYPDLSRLTAIALPALTLDDIEKDIDRTFPQHVLFEAADSPGQASLRRLLRWYASVDGELGYCQGMAFIAAMMLIYMAEEDAFYCFTAALMVGGWVGWWRTWTPLNCLPPLSPHRLLFVCVCAGRALSLCRTRGSTCAACTCPRWPTRKRCCTSSANSAASTSKAEVCGHMSSVSASVTPCSRPSGC